MNKKRAIKIAEQLLSYYRSEWEGTTDYSENYQEYLEAVNYIENNL